MVDISGIPGLEEQKEKIRERFEYAEGVQKNYESFMEEYRKHDDIGEAELEEVDNAVETYAKVMKNINTLHNRVSTLGDDELAEEAIEVFAGLVGTQSEYKEEAVEATGTSPSEVFKELQ